MTAINTSEFWHMDGKKKLLQLLRELNKSYLSYITYYKETIFLIS